MSLPKMTTPVNNISLLDDLPNAVGGLSAAELKARFDKAGGDIQTFLNETLIPAIEQMGVDEGAARDAAIQAAIDALDLDTTVENLQKAIVAAESRAKEYADTKDAANLAAAKQYADTKAAAAQSAAESTAATDAASKADAALLAAKSYANQQDAVTLLNADAAAKNYANQQDAATLQSAKEYTDGKIPSKLPNPQKLKFTGAVTGEYDGSEEKTINIPTGGGDVPAVLGNLAAQIGDAAAGTIPVYAGDEAWTIEKLITEYNENTPLSGYIPDTAWVAAYMAAQKALLKLLPDSAAADAGKLLQVGADGAAAWGGKLPTALKNPNALTFTGAATGTYDGSAALTINIPAGGSGSSGSGSGGALKAMSAVSGYIGIPAADLPENGVVWMCFGSGGSTELYTGTVTIQDAGIAVNDMLVITNGTVNPLDQVSLVSEGLAVYGLSASDYRGVWQQVGAGGDSGESLSLGMTSAAVGQIAKISAVDANGVPTAWEPVDMPSGGSEVWEEIRTMEISEDIVKTTISTDNNGAPFSLKKIYIEIKVVPPTNTDITYNATVCCAFNGNDPWGLQRVNLGESPKNGEQNAILMISGFDSYAGKIIPVFVKAPDGQSTANTLSNGKGTYDARGAFSVGTLSDINVPALSPCHSIGIGSYRLSLFAGTTIKIYGVRA